MSFLTGPPLSAISKMLLSTWFRTPGSTLIAAGDADPIGLEPDYPELDGLTPLVVFGGARQQREFIFHQDEVITTSPNIGFDADGHFTVLEGEWIMTTQSAELGASHYLDPAYIAVDSSGRLVLNLQFDEMPQVSNYQFYPNDLPTMTVQTAVNPWPDGQDIFHWTPGGYVERSVEGLMRGVPDSYNFTVSLQPTKDHWHHLLLGCDLGDVQVTAAKDPDVGFFNSTVRGYSKVWAVVDDVPVIMSDHTLTLTGQPDDGAIISPAQWLIGATPWPDFRTVSYINTGHDRPIDPISNLPFGFPNTVAEGYTFFPGAPSYTSSPVIAAGAIGIPASTRFSKSVRHIEKAEFQMWTGSSRDVRPKAIRRLFINNDGDPETDYTLVDKLLGKPAIRLHGSGNWIKGRNTGRLANFAPKGRIKKYEPDPSLSGDQGEPQ